jgi:hypothetical protein
LDRLRRERREQEWDDGLEDEAEADNESSNRDYMDLSSSHQHSRMNASHHFSPTGHVVLSDREGSQHPIPSLLLLGEKKWEDMLSRQSRTLEEAVVEYRRRYGRNPPKGFDLW